MAEYDPNKDDTSESLASKRSRISATTPDWERERAHRYWVPGKRLLAALRDYQRWAARSGPVAAVMRRIAVVRFRAWSAIAGADIPLHAKIGGGLSITHPNGIVIHPDAVMGVNGLLLQQVTRGTGGKRPGAPVLGGHVDVGAGAKILGGIRIGDHAQIGVNAVVLQDVPDHATAVGVPARILPAKPSDKPPVNEQPTTTNEQPRTKNEEPRTKNKERTP